MTRAPSPSRESAPEDDEPQTQLVDRRSATPHDQSKNDPGLTLTGQQTVASGARLRLDGDTTPGTFIDELAREPAFVDALRDAVHAARASLPSTAITHDVRRSLREAGVDALGGAYANVLAEFVDPAVSRGDRVPWLPVRLTAAFGDEGLGPLGLRQPLGEFERGPVALLEAVDESRTPMLSVIVDDSFRERPRNQRVKICEVISWLARALDVYVTASEDTRRWLLTEHRTDLTNVSGAGVPGEDDPTPERVATAAEGLAPNGRAVRVLEELDREATETLTYHALTSRFSVSASRIRQVVGELRERELVETYRTDDGTAVSLLALGSEVLDNRIGRQRRLDDCVSTPGQTSLQAVCPGPARGRGDGPGSSAAAGPNAPYDTAGVSADRAAAAVPAAAAPDGGIRFIEHPAPDAQEGRTHRATVDPVREEVTVAVRATSAASYVSSIAIALASRPVLNRLPDERLERLGSPSGTPSGILRDARCIGALDDDALNDPDVLRDNLAEWGRRLEELTTKLGNGDHADRNDLRGEMLRCAQGLAGTVVHLLDVIGFDVVREVSVPSNISGEREQAIAVSIARSAAIQSHYREHATWRQLFESREDKRDRAMTPDVDAADPSGSLIGGFVVRGAAPTLDRLEDHLQQHLAAPDDLADDAPEFVVDIGLVRGTDRRVYAESLARVARSKRLRLTRKAVTALRALTGSPYDAAEAVGRGLAKEDRPARMDRELRADEVRTALASLPSSRLEPDLPRSVGTILRVLCRAERLLTPSEVADRADVSKRTVRRHRDRLVGLGLLYIDSTNGTWRLSLAFGDEGERYPKPVREMPTVTDALWQLAEAVVDDATRFGDPDDPVCGPLLRGSGPPDPGALPDEPPWSVPYREFLERLVDREYQRREADLDPGTDHSVTVRLGGRVKQQSLTGAPDATEMTSHS